jgi:uncharacterized Zn-finger protein
VQEVLVLEEYERHNNDQPVCPYCGCVYADAFELGLDDDESTEVECVECDKEFRIHAEISVSYSTDPIGGEPDGD